MTHRSPARIVATLALALAALAPGATAPADFAPVPASSAPFAVIAYSPSTGKCDWARDPSSMDRAMQAAVAKVGTPDAEVVARAWGGYYCALAVDPDAPGVYCYGAGPTAAQAQAMALRKCRDASANPDRCRVAVCVYSGAPAPAPNAANCCLRCGRTVLPFASYCRDCDVRR